MVLRSLYHMFVQPESEQDCLLGMNTLPRLGIKVHRANGEPLRQSGERETKSQAWLVHTVVIPSHKAKFVEAKLEGLLPEGKEFVFEPDVASMRACGVIATESLVTMQSEGGVFVPVENYDGIAGPGRCSRVGRLSVEEFVAIKRARKI